MALEERSLDVRECPDCGELRLRKADPCCGRSLEPVDVPAVFEPPSVEDVVVEVFDVSETELVVCHELMALEEATVRELASRLSRDRSVVQRHLSHLHDLGFVEKRSRSLPDGGRVNVYEPRPIDEVRRRLELGLYAWTTEAEGRIDDLTEEKVAAMIDAVDDGAGADGRSEATGDQIVVNGGEEGSRSEVGVSVVGRLLDRWRSR